MSNMMVRALFIFAVLLASSPGVRAQSVPQTIYQPNGLPAITLYQGGGYTLYGPDGMTVTETAPSTPVPQPYPMYVPGTGVWDDPGPPAPYAPIPDPTIP